MVCNADIALKPDILLTLKRLSLQVHMYSMYGTQLPQHFSMGSEVQRDGIQACQLYSDGLVVLTKALQLWAVSGLQEPRPQKLASPRLKEAPHCMAIFEPRHTLSGCLEVIRIITITNCYQSTCQPGLGACGASQRSQADLF